jgi:hypothetical protein
MLEDGDDNDVHDDDDGYDDLNTEFCKNLVFRCGI